MQRAWLSQSEVLLWWMQAQAAAEAMRSAMSQVESALEGREAELQDSWRELKAQAAELSGGELSEDGLQAVIQVLAHSAVALDEHPVRVQEENRMIV